MDLCIEDFAPTTNNLKHSTYIMIIAPDFIDDFLLQLIMLSGCYYYFFNYKNKMYHVLFDRKENYVEF